MNNKSVTSEEVNKIQISMLKKLDEVCKANDIQYFLSGGTMLGAIRHKGFIPWDDDIDVMMTFDNYQKFLKAWQDTDNYKIIYNEIADDYDIYFAKIYDSRTKLVSDNYANSEKMGVSIDVFPLYPLTSDETKQAEYHKIARRLHSRVMNTNKVYLRITMRKASGLKKIIKMVYSFGCRILGRKYWLKKLHTHLEQYVGKDVAGYSKPLTHIEKNGYLPKEWFETSTDALFEGEMYPVPVGYHEFLTQLFGDYMVEKKMPNHKNEFIWL